MAKGNKAVPLKGSLKDEKPVSLKALEKDGWKLKSKDPYVVIVEMLQEQAKDREADKEVEWDLDIKKIERNPLGFMERLKVRAKKVSSSSGSEEDELEDKKGGWKSLLYDGPKRE